MITIFERMRVVLMCLIVLGLAACATGSNPKDPWEPVNRKIFVFNDKLDTWVLKPIAKGYDEAAPLPVRTGVSNFFSNVEDVWIGINNLLQGKPGDAGIDVSRFLINTTLGIFGIFDIATEFGLDKHEEDFGQTLGVWGVGDGPYLMLPFFGPRTLRDAGGFAVDSYVNPLGRIPEIPVRNSLRGLKIISDRADLLSAGNALEEAALDRYDYLRNFYLNRRKSLILDGKRPRREDDDARLDVQRVILAMDRDVESATNRLFMVQLDRAWPQWHVVVPAGEPLDAAGDSRLDTTTQENS